MHILEVFGRPCVGQMLDIVVANLSPGPDGCAELMWPDGRACKVDVADGHTAD